jgi:hypothetical protein
MTIKGATLKKKRRNTQEYKKRRRGRRHRDLRCIPYEVANTGNIALLIVKMQRLKLAKLMEQMNSGEQEKAMIGDTKGISLIHKINLSHN